MRLEIKSTNRIGISQEILTIFAQYSWDLRAIEVVKYFTYVHVEETELKLLDITKSLSGVEGIIHCREIDLLPSERRESHLQALLAKIPDPIIDIDDQGLVLAINQSARKLLINSDQIDLADSFEGQCIADYIDQDYQTLLTDKPISTTITFVGQSYIADLSPVLADTKNSDGKVTGAVIILRTMNTLGRQISLMQTQKEQGIDSIIGHSAKIKVLIAQTLRFAELELPVLVSGETGTGKELLARALHNAGKRAKAPFLAINCAALPEHLLESELFGYAPGAFTGAQKGGKPGLIELANGGTIFLDEIAEMSIYLQAKLLRFLQDLSYRRVGGTKELKANVRIISASHQNLTSLLEKKLFREDLFYRLNVLNLELPPLRERRDDIPLLVQHFIQNAALQVNQKVPRVTEEAMFTLQTYNWPGNIRELQNILFRVVALNTNEIIAKEDLISALSQFDVKVELNGVHRVEDQSTNGTNTITEANVESFTESQVKNWASAQAQFELKMLNQLYPLYPTTRKLAERLKVSHNKIAMKLREHGLK
ncbi:MAG: sigma 54-interacting transcriptional regulator [Alteromonadaceae bacterium]|nr:sigma 54-interacting transcriptional regulator [Alteromonadaceae bacterium]